MNMIAQIWINWNQARDKVSDDLRTIECSREGIYLNIIAKL